MTFVVLAGPTLNIIMAYGENLIYYFQDIVRLSDWNRPEDLDWYHDWTIFYWAWFISWSPFVGMFIARISKGRTIREFLTVVMLHLFYFVYYGLLLSERMQSYQFKKE